MMKKHMAVVMAIAMVLGFVLPVDGPAPLLMSLTITGHTKL